MRHEEGRLLTSVGVILTAPLQWCISEVGEPRGVHHLRVIV